MATGAAAQSMSISPPGSAGSPENDGGVGMESKELDRAIAWQHELLERTAGHADIGDARRAGTEMMRARTGRALPDDIEIEVEDAGGVPAEWVIPPLDTEERVVLYVHGGGWALGCPEEVREMLARIVRGAQARGLSLDYRLAPEHPFPAAVDDVLTAYRWLLSEGVDNREIALAGESAGGNLVLSATLALRDAGEPLPGALALMSPLTDMTLSGNSIAANSDRDPLNQREAVMGFTSIYLGETPRTDPRVSPLLADLTGLPPMMIQVGTAEALLDDSRRLAERARAAGVSVEYEEFEDMIHLFQGFPYLLAGLRATRRLGDFLLQRIGPGSVPVASTR
jgi:monoterpene epsilon-lactone hydrolase